MRFAVLFVYFLFLVHSTKARGVEEFVETQIAGLMGAAHLSYGIQVWDKHHFSVGLGYVPELSNHDDMMIASLKYRYQPDIQYKLTILGHNVDWRPVSLSIAALHGNDDQLYRELPNNIPDGYYVPTAYRVVFAAQTNLRLTPQLDVYWDWSMLDVGLVNYLRNFDFYRDNYDYLGLGGIVSYGLGVRWRFN